MPNGPKPVSNWHPDQIHQQLWQNCTLHSTTITKAWKILVNKTGNDAMPSTLCYFYSILWYFHSTLYIVSCFHSTMCVVHYFYSRIWILYATFFPCCVFCVTFIPHCVLCVTFVPQCVCVVKYFSFHIVCGQHSFCSMHCVICTTFIPWNKKVPHSTNLHSILCAVCAFTPCSMSCVLFLFHATCAMRYIIVLHGMCTTCYFSSKLGLPCIIFIPCYVCWVVILRCAIPVVCLNYMVR